MAYTMTLFSVQNSQGYAKDFLENLLKIWIRVLKKVSPALP
jgi:hypothetical protein